MRPTRTVLSLILLLGPAGCASGPPIARAKPCVGPRTEVQVSGPHGQRLLKGQVANDWYPARALDLGKQGSASIRCTVTQGRGRDCAILREEPAGIGFGTLALRAAAKLDAPKGSDGQAVELHYRWTIIAPRCHRDIVVVDPIVVLTSKPQPDVDPSP